MEAKESGDDADHRDISETLKNLGLVAEKKGKNDEAFKLYRQSLEMKKE